MKKFLKQILNIFLFSALACYVFAGVSSSISLYKIEMNRKQGISALSAVIKKSVDENRLNDVTGWMRLRPLGETATLTGIITPESGLLGPGVFFEISRRQVQLGHVEEALFWSQLGRYRLRFDALRCGAPNATTALDKFMPLFASPKVQDLLEQHPELIAKSIRRVMDFDAKYPARNSPSAVCYLIGKITKNDAPEVSSEKWEDIRKTLRSVTDVSLKKMDGKQP
jgi:hypothetical protein